MTGRDERSAASYKGVGNREVAAADEAENVPRTTLGQRSSDSLGNQHRST
jgi:hypothetical protein